MSDARYLFSQAEMCFRLASGPGPRLADELEALGRALAREAIVEFAKEGGTVPGLKAPLS